MFKHPRTNAAHGRPDKINKITILIEVTRIDLNWDAIACASCPVSRFLGNMINFMLLRNFFTIIIKKKNK